MAGSPPVPRTRILREWPQVNVRPSPGDASRMVPRGHRAREPHCRVGADSVPNQQISSNEGGRCGTRDCNCGRNRGRRPGAGQTLGASGRNSNHWLRVAGLAAERAAGIASAVPGALIQGQGNTAAVAEANVVVLTVPVFFAGGNVEGAEIGLPAGHGTDRYHSAVGCHDWRSLDAHTGRLAGLGGQAGGRTCPKRGSPLLPPFTHFRASC